MWLSNRHQRRRTEEGIGQLGTVTIAGNPAGVYLAGERRGVTLIGPGGYHWAPRTRDAVLTVPTGEEQTPCILGIAQNGERGVLPGEVWISVTPESGIHLRADGTIDLVGDILVNGAPLILEEEEEGGL